jgi:hypothetical protein
MGKENRCHACNLNDMLEMRDMRIAELEDQLGIISGMYTASVEKREQLEAEVERLLKLCESNADEAELWRGRALVLGYRKALPLYRERFKEGREMDCKQDEQVCSVCGLGHSTEDCDLVGDEPQDCIACGARNPSHYLKDGICPLCRDREKLSLAIERAEKAEAEVERLRNCIRGLWNNPTYHGNGITEDIKQIFTLYDLTQDEVDKE